MLAMSILNPDFSYVQTVKFDRFKLDHVFWIIPL